MYLSKARLLLGHSLLLPIATASPLSNFVARQDFTIASCASTAAVFDSRCWGLLNIPDYLNNPSSGWLKTTPTCGDSTKCCIPEDDGWSTCYLRLALAKAGQDCTTLNDHVCTNMNAVSTALAPAIYPQARYVTQSIYGIHDFYSTYYEGQNNSLATSSFFANRNFVQPYRTPMLCRCQSSRQCLNL